MADHYYSTAEWERQADLSQRRSDERRAVAAASRITRTDVMGAIGLMVFAVCLVVAVLIIIGTIPV